jgi:hypothetical protein
MALGLPEDSIKMTASTCPGVTAWREEAARRRASSLIDRPS